MGALDFTHATELRVTIAGVLFVHMFFHLVMPFSGWHFVELAFSETFEALRRGLQNALLALGGVPATVRSDNLSAATHELEVTGGRALTRRFADVLDHFGLVSSRIQPGEAHENGVVEKGHDVLKSALDQALRAARKSRVHHRRGVPRVRTSHRRPRSPRRPRGQDRRGAGAPAATAEHAAARVHEDRDGGAAMVDDPGRRSHVLGAVEVDRAHRRRAGVPRRDRGAVLRQDDRADATAAWRERAPDRLPARDLVPGAQAGGVRQLSLP